MNVVGCDHIINHRETEPLLCLENPVQITAPVPRYEASRKYKFRLLISAKRLELSVAVERLEPLELSSVLITA